MSEDCCGSNSVSANGVPPRYRRVLWIALIVNLAMFGVEIFAGWQAGSVSLLADAVDFFGDAANYSTSLLALGLAPIWRSRTALLKGLTMGTYGLFVLAQAAVSALNGTLPDATTMGAVGFLALLANAGVAALLYAYRDGDANMRSVWLCSRNDAIGNLAVMIAALGVFGSGTAWPDLAVALGMAVLGLSAARTVIARARKELRSFPASPARSVWRSWG
jgi:Co/Zn/Cd efflux system component